MKDPITVPLADLKPLERNPRRHPPRQIEELVRSVKQFGQYRPLVVDENLTILAGNGLFHALSQMGVETCSVVKYDDLTENQKRKLILTDNRTSDLSSEDGQIVEEILRELDGDFDVPGFDPEVIEALLADASDLVEEANQYGVLDEETRAALLGNSEALQKAAEESEESKGRPPAPAFSDTPSRRPEGGPAACPTCGRAW